MLKDSGGPSRTSLSPSLALLSKCGLRERLTEATHNCGASQFNELIYPRESKLEALSFVTSTPT